MVCKYQKFCQAYLDSKEYHEGKEIIPGKKYCVVILDSGFMRNTCEGSNSGNVCIIRQLYSKLEKIAEEAKVH